MTIFPLMLIRAAGLPLQWLDDLAAYRPLEAGSETDVATTVMQAFDAALSALPDSPLRTAVYNARRDFYHKRKKPAPAFFQRIEEGGAQPEIVQLIEILTIWEKKQSAKPENLRRYESALHANYRLLQQAARDNTLQRALLFASHDLLLRLSSFSEKPLEKFNKKDRQTALSLLQYLTRAAAKTSPLSRFTTVALERIGDRTGQDDHGFLAAPKPQITPNVALLPALYDVLLHEPAFYRKLPVLLNPCITPGGYPSAGSHRYRWLYFDGENESFQQIENNPAADAVVAILLENERRMPFPQLISRLENEIDAEPEQLQTLVFELIDFGLLEWDLPEKGLSPGWCGGLYQFLGFLPAQPPVVLEAAALLQWLRTAARSLPFLSLEGGRMMQLEAVQRINDFFEQQGRPAPLIPPEQIFYEDVAETLDDNLPDGTVHSLQKDLAACWRQRDAQRLPSFRARLAAYAQQKGMQGQVVDFLTFCEDFLMQGEGGKAADGGVRMNRSATEKIGALLQVFQDETGACRAVVNGLFPGGGKLFARWLHLFPGETIEHLKQWIGHAHGGQFYFPWQGWSNANFQPSLSRNNLAVPGGRTLHLQGGRQVLLGDLAVQFDAAGFQLIDKETNEPVLLNDLGLESPESRPPAMQVLWHLGVPYVSLEALLPSRTWKEGGPHWRYAERKTFGSLILERKTWQIDVEKFAQWLSNKKEHALFSEIRTAILAMGINRRFFARFIREKPQYFDLDSPLSVQLLAKMLARKQTPLFVTEMLPLPEQCIVQKNGLRAAEFVFEFEA